MLQTVISVENLSKSYQLGVINTGTFRGDLVKWWAKTRGKPDPLAIIGEVNHGNRERETLWALKDVNFQVQQGEALGIIGRNGSGKSTLLKILSRVTAPTSGEIKVKGRIASLLEVGTGFHPELTGRENIFLNGAILGMSELEIRRKFDEIVSFSGVEQFIDTPVKRYSSGMYVRLAFAVAAHLDPDILIVDEVLAVGDITFQRKCLGKMKDIAKGGRTVLFVSHQMPSILALTQKCILLDSGKIISNGETESVVSEYIHRVEEQNQPTGKMELIDRPRNGKRPRNIEFIEITLLNEEGLIKGSFVEGENIVVQVKFKVKKPDNYFELILGLFLFEGIRVFSIIKPKESIELSNGLYLITTKISPNYLRPGRYSIMLKMQSSIVQDDIPDAINFEILHNRHDEDSYYWSSDGRGVMRINYQWDEIKAIG